MIPKKTGFTIVELMIALSLFAVVSVIVLAGVLFIGRQYQQSSDRIAIEDASRNLHQQISQSLQFSPKPTVDAFTPIPGQPFSKFCVGKDKYVFNRTQIIDGPSYESAAEGLYLLSYDGCSNATTSPDAVNLLPPGAKVAYFNFDFSTGTLSTIIIKAPSDGGDLIKDVSGPPAQPEEAGCDSTVTRREYCTSVKFDSATVGRLDN